MSNDALQFALLLAGWIVALLLGKELHNGFQFWRAQGSEARDRSDRR
ncbi:MAG: hypothetical protein HYX52_09255 [Chloroflexi bacterium]|nr:hypothetical protein [Chloroflexota bacterium]